ncbi:N-acetyltransferase [uncultured Bacteroides sp.]
MAATLVTFAMDYTKEKDLKVIAICLFVRTFIQRPPANK